MLTSSYRVRLPGFEGPLDVLLFFVQREEFPITEVPLGRLVEQFLNTIGRAEVADLDSAAEFLVLVAEFLALKARWLLRRPAVGAEAAEQPPEGEGRESLWQRLLEYRRYKYAAAYLRERIRPDYLLRSAPLWWQRSASPQLEHTTPGALVEALHGLFRRLGRTIVALSREGGRLSLEECAARLLQAVRSRACVPFSTVVRGQELPEVVLFFLVLLELLRQAQLSAEQDEVFGEIVLSAAVESARGGDNGGDAPPDRRGLTVCQ